MLDKFPVRENEVGIARAILHQIDESSEDSEFMLYFLATHKRFTQRFNLSDYPIIATGEEMKAVLDSEVFNIDIVNVEYLTSDAAYLLYTTDRKAFIASEYILGDDRIPSDEKADLILPMVNKALLLDRALTYARPIDVSDNVLFASLRSATDSTEVLLKYYQFTKTRVWDILRGACRDWFNANSVKLLCIHTDITLHDLEVLIMENPIGYASKFKKGCVKCILKLGVTLGRSPANRQLIGEKIAFNCSRKVWEELKQAGFNFNACGTDLIINTLSKKQEDIVELLKYVTEYDNTVDYKALQVWRYNRQSAVKWQDSNVVLDDMINTMGLMDNETDRLEGGNILWNNIYEFYWLYDLNPKYKKYVTKGIPILQKTLENIILRSNNDDIDYKKDNFTHWLILCTRLKRVEIDLTDDNTIITIGTVMVILPVDVLTRGKYKGLDLFSRQGDILTTREDIKARRRELQATLP
jgi:hypothetical protein